MAPLVLSRTRIQLLIAVLLPVLIGAGGGTLSAQASVLGEVLVADADADLVLNGQEDDDPTSADIFGDSVACAGDFNGDGLDDVIVGNPVHDGGARFSGSAYVFFGGRDGPINNPDMNADVVLHGAGEADSFGISVAGVGDFNGDGLQDIVIGAPGDDDNGPSSGSAFVFFGRDVVSPIVLFADTDADIVIRGDQGSQLGNSVASAGDFDGDGKDDLIVGGWDYFLDGVCRNDVHLIFGRDLDSQLFLDASSDADVVLSAGACNDGFGISVSTAGDFNADGRDDVIVGAFTSQGRGSAYVYFGGRTGTITDPELQADVVLHGDGSGLGFGEFGISVSSAGDFNGDGFDDVIIGDSFYFVGAGVGGAFVFLGGETGILDTSDAALVVSTQGVSDFLGLSVAGAGDFDGDGLDDVIIGAAGDNCADDCVLIPGAAFLFRGGRSGSIDDPVTGADVVFLGQDLEDFFGGSVASAGNFGGDAAADVIIGATGDNNVAAVSSGSAFLFFGQGGEPGDLQAPSVLDLSATPSPVVVQTTTVLTAVATDVGTGNSTIASASYTIDGAGPFAMQAADGAFDETVEDLVIPLGFDEAGTRSLCITCTDSAGNVSREECLSLVVFDPDAGAVFGCGSVHSPEGSCTLTDACAIRGRAQLEFTAKYRDGESEPRGHLVFRFACDELELYSSSYEFLVVDGARAQFQGSGTINGEGNYGFRTTVIDSRLDPSTSKDLFRMEIWDRADGNLVVYDNSRGLEPGTGPISPVFGGRIVIRDSVPVAGIETD